MHAVIAFLLLVQAPVLQKDGLQFRDLNRNGVLDPYEDWRQYLPGVSTQTTFSQWPEALGFAAIDDAALTRRFGDVPRQEYRAVGIHMALSPQADLATELDSSVVRILAQKFAQGLFEHPFVSPDAAARLVGNPTFLAAGVDAQRRALVLLENRNRVLPLRAPQGRALRVYVHGISADAATREGWTIVTDPKQADVAIVRLSAPFERLHPQYVFGQFFHEGGLAFKDGDPDYETFKQASADVPHDSARPLYPFGFGRSY